MECYVSSFLFLFLFQPSFDRETERSLLGNRRKEGDLNSRVFEEEESTKEQEIGASRVCEEEEIEETERDLESMVCEEEDSAFEID